MGTIDVPEDLRYNRDHIWVKEEGGTYVIGWTEFAVHSAGDVSYLTLPKKGVRLEAGKEFGSVETGKWVGRLTSPVTGEVVDVNEAAVSDPGLVSDKPFTDGWFLRVKAEGGPSPELMSPEEYFEIVKEGKAF